MNFQCVKIERVYTFMLRHLPPIFIIKMSGWCLRYCKVVGKEPCAMNCGKSIMVVRKRSESGEVWLTILPFDTHQATLDLLGSCRRILVRVFLVKADHILCQKAVWEKSFTK